MKDARKSYGARGTGSTLSRSNLEALTELWQSAMAGNARSWQLLETVLDPTSMNVGVLRKHDATMLTMLRNFVQSKRIITDELKLRLTELADIEAAIWTMLDDPAISNLEKEELRKLVADANPSKLPKEGDAQ